VKSDGIRKKKGRNKKGASTSQKKKPGKRRKTGKRKNRGGDIIRFKKLPRGGGGGRGTIKVALDAERKKKFKKERVFWWRKKDR